MRNEVATRLYNSSKDYEYTARSVADESQPVLYMGAEVEFEFANGTGIENARQIGSWLNKNHDFVDSVVGDGSLRHGLEIRLDPVSFGWLRENYGELAAMLNTLRKEHRATAYQTKSCGGHIHLSRKAFQGDHIYRFLSFVYDPANREQMSKVSRRTECSRNEWAKFEMDNSQEELRRKVEHGFRGAVVVGHDTLEMRLFRGTLHPDGLLRNYMFCSALHEATKASTLTWEEFSEWLKPMSQYQLLSDWLVAKQLSR